MKTALLHILLLFPFFSFSSPLENLEFKDIRGRVYRTQELFSKPTIVFFRGADCPISKRQTQKISSLTRKYGRKMNVFAIETAEGGQFRPDSNQIQIFDKGLRLASLLGAKTSTESFLISGNEILYRGAIDNQMTFSGTKPNASSHFLENAIAEFRSGKSIALSETTAFGCYLAENEAGSYSDEKFNSEIRPIVINRCLNCHSSNMSLPDFSKMKSFVKFKPMIKYVIHEGIMPPWSAVGGEWRNDLRLRDDEKKKLLEWAGSAHKYDGDALLGPKTPPSIPFPNADYETIEYKIPPFEIPAQSSGEFKYVKLKLKNKEDLWILPLRLVSSIGGTLHHSTTLLKQADFAAKEGFYDETTPHQGAGFYALGMEYQPTSTNEGAGLFIPKNSILYVWLHYEPIGTAQTENLKIQIFRYKEKPKKLLQMRSVNVLRAKIKIPPGASDYMFEQEVPLNTSGLIESVHAHMHLRGKRFLLSAIDQSKETEILRVNQFNYKMQLMYQLAEPIKVTKGQLLRITGWFDNSIHNPDNPDPKKEVLGGNRAVDEMLFGTFFLISPMADAEENVRAFWNQIPKK